MTFAENWLHLMDVPGRLQAVDQVTLHAMAVPLMKVIIGMLNKERFLPKNIKNLVRNAEDLDQDKVGHLPERIPKCCLMVFIIAWTHPQFPWIHVQSTSARL